MGEKESSNGYAITDTKPRPDKPLQIQHEFILSADSDTAEIPTEVNFVNCGPDTVCKKHTRFKVIRLTYILFRLAK